MSDRDELAGEIGAALANAYDDDSVVTVEEPVADVLWSAGWRKKPSRGAMIATLAKEQLLDGYSWGSVEKLYGTQADAILALMDGPTETGEK